MHHAAREAMKRVFKRLNLGITRYSRLEQLEKYSRAGEDLALLLELPEQHSGRLLKLLSESHSQYRQDLFVLSELNFKQGGFFVEFGATNGVDLSNTYLLEKQFAWSGIVAEPAARWHAALKSNRSCRIETDCVWRESNANLTFNEAGDAEFSTIDSYSSSDHHREKRKQGKRYEVRTISLLDLLHKHGAPEVVDYLSIDTEGSEYQILSHFDFSRYQFRVITCEHNLTARRDDVYRLLTAQGYVRKLQRFSVADDWYVKAI
jgi:FkbM family methyltransferase